MYLIGNVKIKFYNQIFLKAVENLHTTHEKRNEGNGKWDMLKWEFFFS